MRAKNVTRVSLASRAARADLQDTLRMAILPAAERQRIEQEKATMLVGVRFALRTLGVDRDTMLSRFVEQEYQAWVRETEQKIAPAPPRKQPQRIEPKQHGGKRRA